MFKVCKAVLQRKFSVSDLGIPYRWIHHWEEKGLLLSLPNENGNWRKFNFIDFLWIEIIVELRKCGLSLENIGELKQMLVTTVDTDGEHLSTMMDFDHPSFREEDRPYFNVFMLLVTECLTSGADIFLLINARGQCLIYNESTNHEFDSEIYHFRQKTHVSLSLRHILVRFITQYKIIEDVQGLALLSQNEFEIIALIRNGKVKQVIVDRSHGVDLVLGEDELTDKNRSEYMFVDSILNQSYKTITYTTSDLKKVEFQKFPADQ